MLRVRLNVESVSEQRECKRTLRVGLNRESVTECWEWVWTERVWQKVESMSEQRKCMWQNREYLLEQRVWYNMIKQRGENERESVWQNKVYNGTETVCAWREHDRPKSIHVETERVLQIKRVISTENEYVRVEKAWQNGESIQNREDTTEHEGISEQREGVVRHPTDWICLYVTRPARSEKRYIIKIAYDDAFTKNTL